MKRFRLLGGLSAVALAFTMVAFQTVHAQAVTGTVKDAGQQAVSGATVYLVPAADVAKMAKAPSNQIRRNVDDDEPMEDNLAANRDKYAQGVTDAKGAFTIPKVGDGKFFVYVQTTDPEHSPGGDHANKSRSAAELSANRMRSLTTLNAC